MSIDVSRNMVVLYPHKGGRNSRIDYTVFTHKQCSKCKEVKPVSEFGRESAGTHCRWTFRSQCKSCGKKACSHYGASNRQKRNARLKSWRKNNPERARQRDRQGHLKRSYSLSVEAAEAMFFMAGYRCEICGEKRRLCIDHCHLTGRVRGVLCSKCNTFLGFVDKNPNLLSRIEAYLKRDAHVDVLLEIANGE